MMILALPWKVFSWKLCAPTREMYMGELGARGLYRLHHWLVDGKNTLVVGGGDDNIAFINGNCIGPDGGFSLKAERVRALNLAQMH